MSRWTESTLTGPSDREGLHPKKSKVQAKTWQTKKKEKRKEKEKKKEKRAEKGSCRKRVQMGNSFAPTEATATSKRAKEAL
jgi:hypothetical protein